MSRGRLVHGKREVVPLQVHVWMLINPCFELWEIILAVRAFQIC
ncbi:hypothetical protein PSYMO_36453, partial [Pseudomonas amygdali pv. mori str. 301020]